MNAILTALFAIIIFAVVIFVHEFGHFIAAKLSGIKVVEFALGMGPKTLKKKWGETLYSVRLFPIGGFCQMEGEDEEVKSERSFSSKKPYIRLIVLVSGAFMNVLLGFVLLICITAQQPKITEPVVSDVMTSSASEDAGIKPGDEIVSVNGRRVHISEDVTWEISNNKKTDGQLDLVLKNDGKKRTLSVIPKETDGQKSYGIVLVLSDNSVYKTVKTSFYRTCFYARVVVDSLVNLITGKASFSQISGPVGIVNEINNVVVSAQQTGESAIKNLLLLTILLTINLGVFNLVPFPALDGGKILFVIIEMIRRKPVPIEKEAMVHFVGIVILLLLSVLIVFKDIFTIW